ncbi:MAG: hypothetical protein HQ543_10080 [Bacteroidetes bacterium]|nr:hypothetical protein [Bacteroidota bacterium]
MANYRHVFSLQNDGLATIEKIQNTKVLLPKTIQYIFIASGNHAHFCFYGLQGMMELQL